MSIPTVRASVLSYFRRFDLSAIARTRDGGRLVSTRDPSGAEAAWWMRSADISQVLQRARADHQDVPAAARALRIKIIEHSQAVQHTEKIVAKLDARLRTAKRNGDMGFINREFRQRRLQAQAEGRPFMPYKAAQARLRKALVGVAAGDPAPIVTRVFGDRPPDPQ
jgi:hypothetical protein